MTNEYLKIVEQMGKYKTVQNIMHHVNKETLYLKHKHKRKSTRNRWHNKDRICQNIEDNLEKLVEDEEVFIQTTSKKGIYT